MDNRVDAGEQFRVGIVRVPLPLVVPCGLRRTSRITRWPPVLRNAVNAEPTSPDDPVTATVAGLKPCSAASRCAAKSSAS